MDERAALGWNILKTKLTIYLELWPLGNTIPICLIALFLTSLVGNHGLHGLTNKIRLFISLL